jgi:hypothetical protein
MSNYWMPQYKWQFVQWFEDQNILTRAKSNRMSLKQLRGKYCEIRNRE